MNGTFHRLLGSKEIDVILLYGKFAVGATGAPTLDTAASKNISTVVRNSAGKYTITLSEPVQSLLWADVQVIDATNSDPNSVGTVARIFSNGVTSVTPTLVVQFYDVATGAAVDPRNGAEVRFKLELRNSTVG